MASLDVNDDYKLSNESSEITNNAHQRLNSYCDIKQLDNDYFSSNDDSIQKIYTFNDDNDSLSHEIIHVPFLNSTKNDSVFSNHCNTYKDQMQVIGDGCFNNRTNFEVLDALTKDEHSVTFATKSASAVKEKIMESTSSNKSAPNLDKKPSPEDLEHIYNTLSLDVRY